MTLNKQLAALDNGLSESFSSALMRRGTAREKVVTIGDENTQSLLTGASAPRRCPIFGSARAARGRRAFTCTHRYESSSAGRCVGPPSPGAVGV